MTGWRGTALDLFAGAGGWDVAAQWLGIDAHGVEVMPEALATRRANGLKTAFEDVWHGLEHDLDVPTYGMLIASPPCQTFSMAGGGAGRKALDEVVGLIDSKAYLDVTKLRAFGEAHDPRTALVVTPLAYVARDLPTYVVLEQVPPVLPIWERMATELEAWGYSVVTGVLNAEQYGVPQTRRRAILVARADGAPATMPTPTHSRYYSRDPQRLDPGVLPWVSMAEALGWGIAPGDVTVRTSMGAPKVDGRNGTHALDPAERPMHTVTSKTSSALVMRTNYSTGSKTGGVVKEGSKLPRAIRAAGEPSITITGNADRNEWVAERHRGAGMLERGGPRPGRPIEHPALTVTGNASGTTPGGFRLVNGTGANAARRDIEAPAPTMHFGQRLNKVTVEGDGQSIRVEAHEAAALQSFPRGFRFEGTKTKQFLQIGNAVPPLLAQAVLAAATARGDR